MSNLRFYLNDNWHFLEHFNSEMLKRTFDVKKCKSVRLPHTVVETPFHYFDDAIYQMISGYRTTLIAPENWLGKCLKLTFEGAGHCADVFVNERHVFNHRCGYTAFTIDISDHLIYDGISENVIVVKLDSNESLNQPPFGHVIDYMTYGGLYREVYLEVLPKTHIESVFITTANILNEKKSLTIEVSMTGKGQIEFFLKNPMDEVIKIGQVFNESLKESWTFEIENILLWTLDSPNLYELTCSLNQGQQVLVTRFGFREAIFKNDGFYLNGEKIKLMGLNRHQSYPYVGYAMPKGPQENDANLLKFELGCNAVRTSHYPQSQHFINRCDEIGLLVFTEMPGWQHIGNEEWQNIGLKQVEEMVYQYRNHPSIILWGVRINESIDNDAFYQRTNFAAKTLDPSRQTAGVRYIKKSTLLEDVYTYNDFSHNGKTGGVEKKSKVTSNRKAPYMITEFNGHMFPTKSFDSESHRTEHAIRHARVLNDIFGQDEILGGFGWCMFDYNTHKDFGSGDRICYHGVMDFFRNKKPAAYVYQSQNSTVPVLEISSNMDLGEYPGGNRGEVYAFTDADRVDLFKNDFWVRSFYKSDSPFKNLPNGPIKIDDFIGNQLSEIEGFSNKRSKSLKRLLIGLSKFGPGGLPLSLKALALKILFIDQVKFETIYGLYAKYIGGWGDTVTTYTFKAVKDNDLVAEVVKSPSKSIVLKVSVDRTRLVEENSYDVACVTILAVNEHGSLLNFYQEPITIALEGPLDVIGPKIISLKGGMGGTYIKSLGRPGKGALTLSSATAKDVKISFDIMINDEV